VFSCLESGPGLSRTTYLLKFAFIIRVSTCTVASCGPYPYSTCLTLLFFANTVCNKTGSSCTWSIVKNYHKTRGCMKHVRRPGYGRWYPSVLLLETLQLKLLEIIRISGITFKRSCFVFILSILYAIIGTNSKRYVVFLGLLDFFSNVLSLHNRKRNDFATLKNL